MQSQTLSSYRHSYVGTTSFHDIHESKFCGYRSSSWDNHDGVNYIENNKASAVDLDLEEYNLVDVIRQHRIDDASI